MNSGLVDEKSLIPESDRSQEYLSVNRSLKPARVNLRPALHNFQDEQCSKAAV
jgi:hypothetical protein